MVVSLGRTPDSWVGLRMMARMLLGMESLMPWIWIFLDVPRHFESLGKWRGQPRLWLFPPGKPVQWGWLGEVFQISEEAFEADNIHSRQQDRYMLHTPLWSFIKHLLYALSRRMQPV